MSIETNLKIALLNDYYGNLLTDYQTEIIRMYYDEDLSLGEIAEICKVSRQAISDVLLRTKNKLIDYEKKLGIVAKVQRIKDKILDLIDEVDYETAEKLNKVLLEVSEL